MNILIVTTLIPFVPSNCHTIATTIQDELKRVDQQSEILSIPFQQEPSTIIPSQLLMVRALELWNVDRVIALQFPACFIRHPHKTLWLVDEEHPFYLCQNKHNTTPVQTVINNGMKEVFAESRKIFTSCEKTQTQLQQNNIKANLLVPPLTSTDQDWPKIIEALLQ